jgi:hypothetical protein
MAQKKLSLTRQELASFLKTPEQIKQFENLFLSADSSATNSDQSLVRLTTVEQDIGSINGQIGSINGQIDVIDEKIKRYTGQFYDTTTQTAAAINTAYPITFNSTHISNGILIGVPTSRIYINKAGIYNIQVSIQIDNTSAGNHSSYTWLRVNGFDVPQSGFQTRSKGNDSEILESWNYFYQFGNSDYFEIVWSVSDVAIQLTAVAATSPVPAIPSAIVTCTNIG